MKESFKTGDLCLLERPVMFNSQLVVCMGMLNSRQRHELVRVLLPNGQITVYYASSVKKL
jgi:hypothetical protein